jgi:hypothetical protein
MTSALETRIEECRTIVEERRAAAELALVPFLEVVSSEVSAWLPEIMRTEVTADHQQTTTLGIEKLSALKAEIAKLVKDVPNLVRAALGGEAFWAHRTAWKRPVNSSFNGYRWYLTSDKNGPGELMNPLNEKVRSSSSKLLKKYGYTSRSMGGTYFPPVSWSPSMNTAFTRYVEAFEAYEAAAKDLLKAMTEKGRLDAASLWEKA